MTIWHKRKRKIPLYYIFVVSMIWVGLWGADRKLAKYDLINQEVTHCVTPANALPQVEGLLRVGDL